MKLAAAMAAAAGATADAELSGGNGPSAASAQNVAAMVLNQRKVDEVDEVVERLYKKAFAKPKSMLDFFKPVAAVSKSNGTSGNISNTKFVTEQRQASGNKRPNKGSIATASAAKATGSGEKKVKKEPDLDDVIMLIDNAEEEEKDILIPAALPAVKKEEENPPPSAPGGDNDADGATLEVLPSRPSSAVSLSEIDIEAIIEMGFTKSQAEGALRMNSFSVERAADYLLQNLGRAS